MQRESCGLGNPGKAGRLIAPQPAVFLDRDGTLISDTGYLSSPDEVKLLPGAVDLLRRLRESGYLLVVISNQSGIGRGWITEQQAWSVDDRFRALLSDYGITLDAVYYCPHAPDVNCECRKPSPGLLRRAATDVGIDLSRSYMVGDRASDCEAGEAAGCRAILLVQDECTRPTRWTTAHSLAEVFALITGTALKTG
jgi:histidinol-phosphate phosphatase family protein